MQLDALMVISEFGQVILIQIWSLIGLIWTKEEIQIINNKKMQEILKLKLNSQNLLKNHLLMMKKMEEMGKKKRRRKLMTMETQFQRKSQNLLLLRKLKVQEVHQKGIK